jgi:type I restriction enzyme R subunit
MDKKQLSERDICTKFIPPALRQAGWDELTQLREEVSFTKGRILVRGKMVKRGKAKRADYILYYKPNIPLAVIEAKDNNCSVGDGLQQALEYADTLQLPFVFSSNGDGFVFHDALAPVPRELHVAHSHFSLDSNSSGTASGVETRLRTPSRGALKTGIAAISRLESSSSSRMAIAAYVAL